MADKQSILDHFGGDFTAFYAHYLPDLKGGKANCPFHDCDSRSLSVDSKTGLFNCHFTGCGASGDVFTFYQRKHDLNGDFPATLRGIASDFGISANGAIPERPETSANPGKPVNTCPAEKKASGRIVKTYDYTDAEGKLLFQVCRMEPKDFRQRRPDGNGGWIWNMDGIERVLYRLPEVLKADEVWIVEGEKDADSLAALRFTATTNAGGAGKWVPSYSEALAGKRCVFIPDQDKAGEKHAAKVLPSIFGKAASVKVIELPLGVKDVSDFIQAQPDTDTAAERLSMMADGAAEWTPTAENEQDAETPSGFKFIHNADILADLKPIEWRIRDILTDHALYYNFGDPGHFKTFIELDRLLCIAAGIDYHGHKVKQGTVFYICGEGWQGIGRRLAAWHISHGTKAADVPFFVSETPTQLTDLEAIQEVKRAVDAMAKQYGPPAVVHIDTLARNFGEGDENTTKDMNAAISNLDRAFGAGFCRGLTHHTGHKDKDRARGAMALHGAADGAYRISLTDSGQIVTECKKLKDAPTAPMMVFNRREVLLQIGDTEDRSYVLDLAAEGDEAANIVTLKKAVELKGGLQKALDTLRRLYARYEDNLRKCGRSCATPAVSFVDWRTACMDAGLYKRTDNFRTAAERLLLHGLIRFDDSKMYVHLVEMVSENEN
jgi:hypothetical protein